MVVERLNVKGIILFKPKNDAPIGPYRYGPQALQIASERMQAIAGEIQSLRCRGRIEQNRGGIRSTVSKRSGPIPLRSPRS